MYRIGEFSILQNVSIKTLRYYDEIDLFKPAITDSYTGYRYYSEEQMKEFYKISYYKDLGFSLEEIKKIMKGKEEEVFLNKRNQYLSEINEKENQLRKINDLLKEKKKIEFQPYHEEPCVVKKVTLKKREDYFEEVKKIKEEIIKLGYTPIYPMVSNLEVGYVEENMDTLIGYTVKERERIAQSNDLFFLGYSKAGKQLVGHGMVSEINSLYQEMVQYAHENNIQIRGFFTAIIKENEIEMYVEAFDLQEKNEDYLYYLDHFKKEKEIDSSLVGTYQIREILPDTKFMFNSNKQKSMLDTNFKILELKKDGSTNYENITWNKKQLILNYNNKEIPLPLYKEKIEKKEYLEILMNESYEFYESQRPMSYLYEKK